MKNALKLIIAAGSILLTACSPSDDDIREAVKKQVNRAMKDPTTSLFQDITLYRDGEDKAYACGEVNGKNEYGAYTGFKPFVANVIITKDAIVPLVDYADKYSYDDFAPAVCETKGIEQARKYIEQLKLEEEARRKEEALLEEARKKEEVLLKEKIKKDNEEKARAKLKRIISKQDYEYITKMNESLIKLNHSLASTVPKKIRIVFYTKDGSNDNVLLTYSVMEDSSELDAVTYFTMLEGNGKIVLNALYYAENDTENKKKIAEAGEEIKKLGVLIEEKEFIF